MTDFTTKPLVHTIPGADAITVERGLPYSADPAHVFDVYRPPGHAPGRPPGGTASPPAVVFVSGLPDPGVVQMLGRPLKDWASYVGWARMIAASGIVGITYANREPSDVLALLAHLRAHAAELGIDPARIAIWACSGNVPTALGVLAHQRPAAAALLYGYLLDLDGATAVADAAKQFYFAVPPVTLDDLPRDVPLLVVRAGQDPTPGLDATLLRFVDAARARGLRLTLLEHPAAPHAFDLVDDSPRTHEVIDGVLAFLRASLGLGESGDAPAR